MYNLFSGRFVLRSQFTLLSCKGWRCIVILSIVSKTEGCTAACLGVYSCF